MGVGGGSFYLLLNQNYFKRLNFFFFFFILENIVIGSYFITSKIIAFIKYKYIGFNVTSEKSSLWKIQLLLKFSISSKHYEQSLNKVKYLFCSTFYDMLFLLYINSLKLISLMLLLSDFGLYILKPFSNLECYSTTFYRYKKKAFLICRNLHFLFPYWSHLVYFKGNISSIFNFFCPIRPREKFPENQDHLLEQSQ